MVFATRSTPLHSRAGRLPTCGGPRDLVVSLADRELASPPAPGRAPARLTGAGTWGFERSAIVGSRSLGNGDGQCGGARGRTVTLAKPRPGERRRNRTGPREPAPSGQPDRGPGWWCGGGGGHCGPVVAGCDPAGSPVATLAGSGACDRTGAGGGHSADRPAPRASSAARTNS